MTDLRDRLNAYLVQMAADAARIEDILEKIKARIVAEIGGHVEVYKELFLYRFIWTNQEDDGEKIYFVYCISHEEFAYALYPYEMFADVFIRNWKKFKGEK